MLQTINLESHFEELSHQGWTLLPVPDFLTKNLANSARRRHQQSQYKEATLSQSPEVQNLIRNDQILWLDAKYLELTTDEQKILDDLTDLKKALTDYFRIHMSELECHYAIYEAGHFYHRHRDITTVNNKRVFSFVIYLNEDWLEDDGGHLVAYENEQILFRLRPQIGSMILFKSDIEHEVLATKKQRVSLTGWFRK